MRPVATTSCRMEHRVDPGSGPGHTSSRERYRLEGSSDASRGRPDTRGCREVFEVPDVVVVEVGEHHVRHTRGVDTERFQTFGGTAEMLPYSPRRYFGGKVRVNDRRVGRGHCGPHEVIHRHGTVV